MRKLFISVVLLNIHMPVFAINDSDVIVLINNLASPTPSKCKTGMHPSFDLDTMPKIGMSREQRYYKDKLIEAGTAIYPILIRFINDERYCYTDVNAACIEYSVGNAIRDDVLSSGIEMYSCSGYQNKCTSRKNPSGINSRPDWCKYLQSLNLTKWAENAKKSKKEDLKKAYINWCIHYENNYGFIDNKQRAEVLAPYYTELEKIDRLTNLK